MLRELQLRVSPETANRAEFLEKHVSDHFGIPVSDIRHVEILRRSVDARQKNVMINLKVGVYVDEDFVEKTVRPPDYSNVDNSEEVIIIGAGPAGLFAALTLIENGKKPVIIERGKDVRNRIADLKNINLNHIVNEDSNYCFGEGGAGTYSDGKLYTRAKKRGNIRHILELLVSFGATRNILVEAHPHIGTNKLPAIISKIRNFILERGGKIHFNRRVTDFLLNGNQITGVKTLQGDDFKAKSVILATGHSARDIFELLHHKKIEIELKPMAVGVRVEHPQSLIDHIQYGTKNRSKWLPPAAYSIVKQVKGRGVYSFCMCPGGVIAPCATKQEEIVTNGWSSSRRARSTANSGIVVELHADDFKEYASFGPLAAMEFQKYIERECWLQGGKTQTAPAQRLVDFTDGKISSDLPKTSYSPGITSVNLESVLPKHIFETLQLGFRQFEKSMRGYLTNEAVVHAPETRTSSPVRIPRNSDTLQHIRIQGLYPCGEGAGFAGGIVSAALDGRRCASKICSSV